MSADRIEALRQVLLATPDNQPLRLLLAELLQAAGRLEEALAEYDTLLRANQLGREQLVPTGELALQVNNLDLASRCLDAALKAGVVEGLARLRSQLDAKLAEQGYLRVVLPTVDAPGPAASSATEEQAALTFAEVGGLEEVKKAIHKLIILPLLRPDVYRRYGRQSGGGVFLFGPPGCGKTMLARATAGECHLPFFNVRIEDVLDPFIGVSERNLHLAFEHARAHAPCVLFLDELDALAFARRKRAITTGNGLVDQLLQELDAIGAENKGVLVLAASNAPWDMDDALLRPGRFDRRLFVPPPDAPARERILQIMLTGIPTERLDLKRLARATPLFSGADLRALVDAAIDQAIDEALETGGEAPLTMHYLETGRASLRPTTLDWLERARNYVEFANQDKRYNEVAAFLKSAEARSAGRPV
ncbi:MAG: ATP-binding protein [Chloroflexota bacterium]